MGEWSSAPPDDQLCPDSGIIAAPGVSDVSVRKSTRGQHSFRDPKVVRRDPRAEADDAVAPPVEGSIAPRDMVNRVRGLTRSTMPPDLSAALVAEKEARARDAAMLGEMFVRACDADAKRRMAETAADALAQRVATLESELRELRARGGAMEAAVAHEGEARARGLEARLHAAEEKLRRGEELLRTSDERARSAEHIGGMLEQAARASKDESASLVMRIESLELELRSARSDREDEQGRAAELARRVEELSVAAARATEVETLKARAVELERNLAAVKDEHARTVMKVTLAETRAEELTNQVNDYDQRASSAEWEAEKARSDAEAARRRSTGIETELARVMKRTAELERDLTATRGEAETAETALLALRAELDGLRTASDAARAELERAVAARSALEGEARARADGNTAARNLLADLEIEEQRTNERRRTALAEVREVLARGDGVASRAPRVALEPAPSAPTRPTAPGAPPPIPKPPAMRGSLTGMQGLLGDRPSAAAVPAPVPVGSADAPKAVHGDAAKRK